MNTNFFLIKFRIFLLSTLFLCNCLFAEMPTLHSEKISVQAEKLKNKVTSDEENAKIGSWTDFEKNSKLQADLYNDCLLKADRSPRKLMFNIGRFVGKTESFLNVSVPIWFVDCLENSKRSEFQIFEKSFMVKYDKFDSKSFLLGRQISFDKTDMLHCERPVLTINRFRELVHENSYGFDAKVVGDRLLLACYTSRGANFRLYCINILDGKIVWEQIVWASYIEQGTGPSFHQIELVVNDKEVVVFGNDIRLYIEKFNILDGKPILKFNSKFWAE